MKNMKVSTRLQTGFGLLTALLLVLAGIALFGLSELNDSLDGIARVNNEETRLANELRASIQDRAIAIRNLALITEPRDLAQEADRIKKQDQNYAEAYQQLTRLFAQEPATTSVERSLIEQLKQDEAAAMPPLRKAMDLALSQNAALATQELLQNARPPQRAWLARATELARVEDEQNKEAQLSAFATYSTVRTMISVIAAIAFLLGVATAALISRSILRQLGGEPRAAQEMAADRRGQPDRARAGCSRRPEQFDGIARSNAREAHHDRVGHQDVGRVDFCSCRRDRARQPGPVATHRGTGRVAPANRGEHGRIDVDGAQ